MKPIQQKVLPLALAGQDVVGIAPTGSGKTLAFLVPGLVHAAGQPSPLRPADGPILLVLAPTRELAVQIGSVAEGLLQPSRDRAHRPGLREREGLSSAVLYGGPRRSDQLQTLRFQQGTHLVVATPGRLLDFLRSGAFTLRRVSFFVLDEGDRMLDYGFEPDVAAISAQIRSDRQMLFFSATWPADVEAAATGLCGRGQAFQRVATEPQAWEGGDAAAGGRRQLQLRGHSGITLPPAEIKQVVEVVSAGYGQWSSGSSMDRKLPMLLKHLEAALGGEAGETPGKALVFVGTRGAAEELGAVVMRHFGLDRCGVMHGARKQDQREQTLKAFREGRLRALVSTDVLGRGVDIAHVSHVVIFDFPSDIETYVHRVGRTGRNGQPGTAVAFFESQPWYPDLAGELAEVLRACGQEVPEALAREECGAAGNGGGAWGAGAGEEGSEPAWQVNGDAAARRAPDLEERGSPPLASAEELGDWDAGGARVWGYSANGGMSEQGRLELRAGGLLRTNWGWGEWALVDMGPHCPPPSRPCPPSNGTEEGAVKEGALDKAAEADAKELAESQAREAAREAAAAPAPRAPARCQLALSWSGVTDVVALDPTGLGFELVSRSGRPACSYKKKTLGRALPGVAL